MNLGSFQITSLIVHDVPRRVAGSSVDDIIFSEVASDLEVELKNFFRERMIRSLSRSAYEVERDPDQPSPVPGYVAELAGDSSVLVQRSQDLARHLWTCQNEVNPAGLLVVCLGHMNGSAGVGALKLEREDAIRVAQIDRDGQRTFSIAHLRDLMLGKNTKVFKAALFTSEQGALDGLVSDDQRGYDPHSEVAQFFLNRFLGCQLKRADDVTTKAFFEISQQWINSEVKDEAKKARYEIALLAHVSSPGKTIHVKDFADSNLEVIDRTPFKTYLANHDVPSTAITKETRLIDSKIKQLTYATIKGVRVTGSPEVMKEVVAVRPDDPEGPVIEVRDQLKDVRGGR